MNAAINVQQATIGMAMHAHREHAIRIHVQASQIRPATALKPEQAISANVNQVTCGTDTAKKPQNAVEQLRAMIQQTVSHGLKWLQITWIGKVQSTIATA